ncbi:glycopeptide antibiotics resistance protein [Ruminiclostridium sufflavum DSM 19573]|uniref:Glycopeptide antibiotics resistance protein n=1 Tax=Ruminiclostridium sufflavum DSM 19573 TaxID=1121337 RepID=A0A318XNP5_9FIRM|nr:VanZ family protein [Ruminiclostridium sufflavum]PYG88456.1 glycopeptide antibiotics resistance protein [Ruminiclostridium sufflavum DSM 19573]
MKAEFNNRIDPVRLAVAFVFAGYVLLLAYLTFFSDYYGRRMVHRSINLIPFKTIIEFITSDYNTEAVITNLAGNIAAFLPMGFLLPVAFGKLNSLRRIVFASLPGTLSVELIQYIFGTGASDIDDVILNVLGAAIGYFAVRAVINLICRCNVIRGKK